MRLAFGDAKNTRVARTVFGVEKLIHGCGRRAPIPNTSAERILTAEERIVNVLTRRRIDRNAIQRAQPRTITNARSIAAPDWSKRAEQFDSIACDAEHRRLRSLTCLHFDAGCEPAILPPHRDDRLGHVAEVGDVLEKKCFAGTRRQCDLL